jgi:hypothetical protein
MKNLSNNEKTLQDFTEFCRHHKELRFWQCLRDWSDYAFIYGSNIPIGEIDIPIEPDNFITDTYYL